MFPNFGYSTKRVEMSILFELKPYFKREYLMAWTTAKRTILTID
jgi:hypothetical protein